MASQPIFQFRLWTLLLWMAFVAVAATAFMSRHELWHEFFNLVTMALLVGALVSSVASRDVASRVFFTAFVVATIMYLSAIHDGLKSLGIEQVLTTNWVNNTALQRHPLPADDRPSGSQWKYQVTIDPDEDLFGPTIESHYPKYFIAANICFQTIAIVVGTIASYVCRAIYVLNERRSKRSVDEP